MKVLWGLSAAVFRLYILIAELRVSYVSRFRLSSHSASTAHIDDGRAKGHPTLVVWGFPAAGPLLRILMAELRKEPWGLPAASYVSRFGLSKRHAPPAHTDDGRAKGHPT